MEYKKESPYIIIHLHPDENLLNSLEIICKKNNIQTAVVVSGIGQVKEVTLGYFKEKDNYAPKTFSQPHELLCLTGTIINQYNEIIQHIHAIIGSEQKHTFGGHLVNATVEVTNEIVLSELPVSLTRKKSVITGLMDLSLES